MVRIITALCIAELAAVGLVGLALCSPDSRAVSDGELAAIAGGSDVPICEDNCTYCRNDIPACSETECTGPGDCPGKAEDKTSSYPETCTATASQSYYPCDTSTDDAHCFTKNTCQCASTRSSDYYCTDIDKDHSHITMEIDNTVCSSQEKDDDSNVTVCGSKP